MEAESTHRLRAHRCGWPGCGRPVAPALWGCSKHWLMLPETIRTRIWRAYRPGQEDTNASAEYIDAAEAAQFYIKSIEDKGGALET